MKNVFLFLALSLFLTPTFAATKPSGGGAGWTTTSVTRVGLDDVIEATARSQAVRNGTTVGLEAIVQETINRNAVGKVLLKRLLAGGVLIGATQALVEGVGWVMEEGSYVKYKVPDQKMCPTNDCVEYQYYYISNMASVGQYVDPFSACSAIVVKSKPVRPHWDGNFTVIQSNLKTSGAQFCLMTGVYEGKPYTENVGIVVKNIKYDSTKKPEPQRIVLTDDLMGDLAVGDYTDPTGDKSSDKKDGVWTGVEDAYKEDPTGTGNDLNDRLKPKFDNAPETPTKPEKSPKPDADGQKYPDKDTKPGGQGETDKEKDPNTGVETGKGTFTLPDWCLWASDQCIWHKEEKEVWDKEQSHRDSEKSFWQTVKDWFDWTKEEPEEEEKQQPEIDDQGIFTRKFDTVFSLSKSCPPDLPINFESKYINGSFTFSLRWLCIFFSFIGYPLQLLSHCIGIWILYETVIRKEIKW